MTVIKIILVTLVTISKVTSESAVDSRLNETNSDHENITKILRECPCILRSVCPRIYGESPDDIKYLGLMEDCRNNEEVRCCGVTATYIIGEPIQITTEKQILNSTEIITNEVPTTIELFEENTEIISTTIEPYTTDENNSVRSIDDFTTESYSTTNDVFDINIESTTYKNNANTDETITENNAITELFTTTEIHLTSNTEELLITNETQLNSRQAKQLNNVSYVYPSEMSGIPKTTPKNLPDNHEMKSFDNKMGENILVVFSHDDMSQIMGTTEIVTTTEAIPTTEAVTSTELTVPKIKITTIAKQAELISSNSDQINIKTKIENKRRGYRPQRVKMSNLNANTTTSVKLENSSDVINNFERNRIQDYNKRRRIPIKRTTAAPAINNSKTLVTTESTDSTTRGLKLHLPTHPPRTLFNFDPSSRLNFLKRTLANHQQLVSTVDTENIEETTEAQLNTTFRDLIDNQHKLMIEHVHSALKSRTVLSNFDDKDVVEPYNTGYEYLESMIRNRLAKLDDPIKNDESIDFRTNLQTEFTKERVNTTSKQEIKKPFRGTKRYMVPTSIIFKDSLTTSSNDVTTKRFQRVRSTTPTNIDQTKVISTTAKSPTPPRHLFTRKPKETTLIKIATSTTPIPITTTIEDLTESKTITNAEIEETTSSLVPKNIVLSAIVDNNPELIPHDQKLNLNLTQIVAAINPLLADFRPSPLWTLHGEETPTIHIDFATAARQSRDTFPVSPVELINGFKPIVNTRVPLSIIGPIPSSPRKVNNEQPLIYELPLKDIQRQFQ